MENTLLIDCCVDSGFILNLNESTKESNGLVTFRGKFQEAEAINKNKRSYPKQVLDANVKQLQEAIRDRRLIGELDHPCLNTKDFRVLTVDGWKPFESIRIGDLVYSRVDGKLIPSRVNGIVDKPYDGKIYNFKGRAIDCGFTPDHKFLLLGRQDYPNKNKEIYSKAEEIHNNRKKYNKCVIPKTAIWDGLDEEYITIPASTRSSKKDCSNPLKIKTKKFLAFLGLYLAEGNLKSDKGVSICQKNEYGRKLIRELLTDFHPELNWTEQKRGFYVGDARLHDYLIQFGTNCYVKRIPNEIKQYASEYLEELLLWYAIGDGRMQILTEDFKQANNGKVGLTEIKFDSFNRINVFSTSKDLINDLHECLIKTGRSGKISETICEKDYLFAERIIKAENKKPLYQLNFDNTKIIGLDSRFLKITESHHTGNIYCLMTEHGNFYMEHKGKSFWTGNCDSIVHFANASHLVTKLWWEGNILMGEGQILNTPYGKILKALINDGVKIGISSRGVGSGKVNEAGVLVIGESYKLITFDAVADPSTYAAFQEKVVSGQYEHTLQTNYIRNPNIPVVKNESKRIDTVSKEALIAFFGSAVKSQVEKVKARLS